MLPALFNLLLDQNKHDEEFKKLIDNLNTDFDKTLASVTKEVQQLLSVNNNDVLRKPKKGIVSKTNNSAELQNVLNIAEIKTEKKSEEFQIMKTQDVDVVLNTSSHKMPAPSFIPPTKKQKTKSIRSTKSKRKMDASESTSDLPDKNDPVECGRVTRSMRSKMEVNKDLQNSTKSSENGIQESRSTRSKKQIKNSSTATVTADNEPSSETCQTRSTRTKTIKKGKKNDNLPIIVFDQPVAKEIDNNIIENCNQSSATVYEDAQSTAPDTNKLDETRIINADVTRTLPKDPNCTSNLQKVGNSNSNGKKTSDHNFNIFENMNQAVLTDDESLEIQSGLAPKATLPLEAKQTNNSKKAIFNPYLTTGVKNKVQAFEKLGSEKKSKISPLPKTNTKSKLCTPVSTHFKPMQSSTAIVNKIILNNQSSTVLNNDGLLGMKTPLDEDRFKNQGAIPKKIAMLQAQAELKKRLNTERQLKAQEQRKMLEAEKKKLAELKLLKQERLKLKEKERLEEIKQEERKRRIQPQRQVMLAQIKQKPIYLTQPLPKLPTADSRTDSEEDDYEYELRNLPSWCTKKDVLKKKQYTMLSAGRKIKNSLFCRQIETPDLKDIFENIELKKLKRSSSAHWKQPPRYTMANDFNQTRFSEDDSSH